MARTPARAGDSGRRMRALHVVPAVAPRYGGPSEVALRSVASLREAGIDALLATTDADGEGRLLVATGEEADYLGVPCIFFPRWRGESLKPSPELARWLRGHAGEFDVVHVHSVFSHSSIAAGRAARRAGVPYVVRPLGQLDEWSLAQHAWRKRAFLALAGRGFVERAAALHWTDESEKRRAPRFAAGRPSFVAPLGVDERLFEAREAGEREPVVLFLSRLHPKKNVEALIDAFASLGTEAEGWRLVVAGDGEEAYVASLRSRAAASGRAVDFVGWLTGEQKARVLASSALFVLPSRQENFGIVVAEAMAAGTPVVVSESVALSGDVRRVKAGWVTPQDADGLSRVLSEAISSPSERARRGGAGRGLAEERYRWSAVARELASRYEALAAEKRAA